MNLFFRATYPALAALCYVVTGFSAQAQITIMPMGDSITVGVDYYTVSYGGYRDPLYHDLVASGISFTFVGVNNSDATPTLTAAGQTYHNGYGGYQINDLLNNLAGVAAPTGGGDGNLGGYWLTGGGGTGRGPVTPNIILLQIGANDIRLGASAATASTNLHTLVTTIHSLTPNTIILIAGTCPFANSPGFNTIIQAYDSYIQNTLVPSLSYTRYVDNYTPFLNADGSVNTLLLGTDNIHPTRYGYPIIAQNWANAIRALEGSNPTVYNLTVANGTGSGSYPAGSVVTVNSNTPTTGNQFASWTPATSALDNPYWPIATYVMPAAATTVTANYLATGSPAIPNGTYDIVGGTPSYQFPWNSGLSMAAAGTSSGSLVQQQTYTGSNNQQWVLTNLGNNVVELSLPGTTNALSVVGASTTAGANLDVENYTGAASQQWTITQLYGCTEIVNVNSGDAVNIAGYSTQSGSQLVQYNAGYVDNQLFTFYPASTISPPAAPTGLNASTGSAQISLNWTASSGAISYNVYRGTSANGESATAIATGVTVASYIDTGLTNGTTYYYKVTAVNAGGASAYSNEASAAPLAGGSTQDINLTGYTQTFDDEFNTLSVTTANPKGASNWYAGPANGSTGDFSESNWNISALSVSNGILTDQAYYANPAVNGQNWQSGELSSIDPSVTGFSQKYGYFEIRCQMPNAGTGSWPAFWLDSTSGVTGGQNEEIDIFEWYGVTNTPGSDQDFVSEASHNWNSDGTQNTTQPYIYAPQTAMPDGQYPWQAYHTYGCQIDPVHITWYIDGVQTNQIATPTSYITSPFFMILDYALGGGWPLSGSPIATDGSSSLLVDWVRVYSLPSSSAPSAPTGLSATATSGQVALTWTGSTGAASYNVYRGTSAGGESATPIATSITTASYSDTGLTNGTTYYYEVKAVNTYGTSGSSNEASATPVGGTAPSAPTSLSGVATSGQVVLTWTASTGATSYNVYRGTSAGGESATAWVTGLTLTGYTDTGLTNGTTYYYEVKAVNTYGTSGYSNEASATPAASSSAGVSIGVQFKGTGTALLATDSAGVAGVVQSNWNVLSGSTFSGTVLADSTGTATTATVTGGASGIYAGGGSTASPAGNAKLASGEIYNSYPATPAVGISNIPYTSYDVYVYAGVDAAGRNETVTLTPVGGTAQYGSFTTETGGSAWTAAASTWNGTGTAPTLASANYVHYTGLTTGSFTLTWGAPGNGEINGIEIVNTGGSSAPVAPPGLSATGGGGQVSLNWTASAGATSYNVYRGTSAGGESSTPLATNVTTASYTDTAVLNGTTYYYEVKAVNGNGPSGYSNEASAAPTASIGVQFKGTGTALLPSDLAGLLGVAQSHWNVLSGSTFSGTVLADNMGTATTATVTGGASGIYAGGGSTASPAGNAKLASGEIYNSYPATPTVGIANIPYTSYDVYVYAGVDAAGRNQTVTLTPAGAAAQYGSFKSETGGSAWTAATSTWNGTGTVPTLASANYVHYTGLTAGSFTLTWGAPGNGEINGIEIVNTASSSSGGSAPSAPTGLSATATSGQVALTWTGSTGAASYNVYRGTSAGGESATPIATSITTASYSDTGLTNGTTYYYEVKAVNTYGTSGSSNEASATPVGGTAPSAPTSLSGVATSGQVVLTWTASTGATSYNVYRGTSAGGESATAWVTGLTLTGYTDTGLTNGTTYYYEVKAVNTYGTSGYSNEASATPAASSSAGVSIGVQFKGTGTALLATDSAGVAGVVQSNWNVLSGSTFSGTVLADSTGTATTATVTGGASGIYAGGGSTASPAGNAKLASGEIYNSYPATPAVGISNIPYTSYDVYVYAGVDAAGRNETVTLTPVGGTAQYGSFTTETGGSAWTAAASTWNGTGTAPTLASANYVHYTGLTTGSFTLTWGAPGNGEINGIEIVNTGGSSAPVAPPGLSATGGGGQVSLNWTASAGATSYNVYRGTSAGGESSTPLATNVTTASYTDTAVLNGTTYYYEVKAVNGNGPSGYSNEASAAPTASIGVQFKGTGTALLPSDLAGLLGVAQSHWNVLSGSTFSGTVLADNMGTATTATVTGGASGIYAGGGSTATPAGNAKLASGEIYNSYPATPAVGIANIPYTSYDVYVYAGVDAAGRNQTVTLTPAGAAAQYGSFKSETGGSAWTAATSTWNGTGTVPTLASANYVHYTGLTAGSFTLTWGAPGNGEINGIEIVNTASSSSGGSAPSAPTGLSATATSGQVALTWTGSTGAASYNVYRGTSAGGESATPIATSITTASYSDTGLTNGTTYYYEVKAVNTYGTSGSSNEASATPNLATYALTVTSGTGSGSYAAGTAVTVTAAAPASGYQFAGWTGATSALANPSSATTTLTMPASATTIAATYSVIPTYSLTVTSGTGSGTYAAGTTVTVTANAPASGYVFAGWTGATSALANPSLATTTLTMPAAATSITATYSAIPTYVLTVTSGTGSGTFAAGTVVTVTANAPASGYVFAGWTGATSALANPSLATTTLTMPAAATSITATYSALPTYALTVTSGTGGGSYTAGTVVTVTATAPASGYQFAGWTGATSALANPASATTTLTMPAAATTIAATYSVIGASVVTSVQFPQYYNNSIVSAMNGNNYTGGVVPVQYWNVADTNTGTSPASNASLVTSTGAALGSSILVNSTGANTTLGFTYSGYTVNDSTNNTSFPSAIWYQTGGLTDSYIAAGTSFNETGAPETLSVTGLTATHAYNLIVYVTAPWWDNGGSNPASVSTGSTTYYIKTSNTLSVWTQATSTTSGTPTTGNYVKFSNLTGATSQTVTVTGAYVGLAGFQVVDLGVYSATVPTAPTGLVATAGNAQTSLSWTASAGATSYNVYRGTTAGGEGSTPIATNVTSASYTDTGLTNGTTYYYTVAAVNTAGTSSYSNESSATPILATYALTVTSGSGSGTYAAGTAVTVTATAPASGYQFAGWTGATSALADPTSATTTLTMPAAATSITATYSVIQSTYALTVTSGTGSGNYAAGTVVTVTAAAPTSGYQFAAWTGATSALANPAAATTTLTMPAAATSISATYSQVSGTTYTLSVTNGTGGGNYASGTVVSIVAAAAPTGYQFSGWTESYGGTDVIANATASTTTVTTSSSAATITGNYTPVGGTTYALTVTGGTGSGNYPAGTIVTIAAGNPPNGSHFVRWLGSTSALVLNDADNSTTTITMPSVATTVAASYGLNPTTYAVTVTGGVINNDTGSGHYAAGTVLSVTANAPTTGNQFSGWTGTTGALANAAFSTTNLTVPAAAATITANYTATTSTYALTVNSGTGGGTYAPGTAVTVTANAPASGYQFAGWTGSTSLLSNAAAPTTTFNMGSAAASITANYTAISSAGTLVLAVGLERIVPGYTGPAIRIQRPSDNTQMDIGFASGSNLLDTTAVSNFLGQSQGWITTLYAQDGSGNNVTTPLPTSTSTMPTISAIDPTTVSVNGTSALTARNVEQIYQNGQGNFRYFVLPPSVSVNKSQMSAFLAYRPDFSGSGGGDPYQSLYEVGNPTTDSVDVMSTAGGLQGLTHNSVVTFSNTNIVPRSQATVVGLVTSPGSAPLLYLDGVGHSSGGTVPPSTTCSGGYLLAGTGTGLYYGIPLFAQYNFLGFALYSGTVSSSTASTVSSSMLPHAAVSYNIVADGDSITQGTGSIYGYNMLHYVEPLLNHPADITNIAIYGTTSPSAVGHLTYPTAATSDVGMLYSANYTKNIYYVAIGTNDIHGGFGTGAQTWAEVMQALQDAKAMGYKTTVATVLHETGETSSQAAEVNSFNALARAAVGQPYLDGLIDYAADNRLGNTGIYYPAYTGDGTHPNDAGYQIMGTIAAPVFNSLIGP